jgi:hypothetical protein
MAITFDGASKRIVLDGGLTVSIRDIYSRWVDWLSVSDNSKYLPAFQTIADPPTVPLYATLLNGWLVRPLAGSYILTVNDGFLYVDGGGDPFAVVTSGVEPRIRWENPVIAVGYSTSSPSQVDITAIRDLLEADEVHTTTTVDKLLRGTSTVLQTKGFTGTPFVNFEITE